MTVPVPQWHVPITIYSQFANRSWTGMARSANLDDIFREFNRVDQKDIDHLTEIGYDLPSLSVGDRVTIGPETWVCEPIGWRSYQRVPPYDWTEDLIDGVGFANPGSALRRATRENPRNLPCPNCGEENVLTPLDRARGYQCDRCADLAERGW